MFLKLMLFCILTLQAWAQDAQDEKALSGYDPKVDVISEKYQAGAYLIYDCADKHWVCVLESYYQECQNRRTQDILSKKEILSCAPFDQFPTKKSCFQKQLFLVSQNFGTRFCFGEERKTKEIEF